MNNWVEEYLKASCGEAFVDIPHNSFPLTACEIQVDFKINLPIICSVEDQVLTLATDTLGASLQAIAKDCKDKWDLFHPQLSLIPNENIVRLRVFCKEKEKDEKLERPLDQLA